VRPLFATGLARPKILVTTRLARAFDYPVNLCPQSAAGNSRKF